MVCPKAYCVISPPQLKIFQTNTQTRERYLAVLSRQKPIEELLYIILTALPSASTAVNSTLFLFTPTNMLEAENSEDWFGGREVPGGHLLSYHNTVVPQAKNHNICCPHAAFHCRDPSALALFGTSSKHFRQIYVAELMT